VRQGSAAPLPEIVWASDHAFLVRIGEDASLDTHEKVQGALESLRRGSLPGIRDLHPAYASILITFDPLAIEPAHLRARVASALASSSARSSSRTARLVEIPVCYDRDLAPDLLDVARAHDLATEEVVRLHASAEYVVHFLGFVAGFPYLGGLPAILATPRLPVPRKRVPAGSVAIAGSQAGIYPFSTPGGWRILGRTPSKLFVLDRDPPALLAPGDRVRFVPIGIEEFRSLPPKPGAE